MVDATSYDKFISNIVFKLDILTVLYNAIYHRSKIKTQMTMIGVIAPYTTFGYNLLHVRKSQYIWIGTAHMYLQRAKRFVYRKLQHLRTYATKYFPY